MKVETVHPLGPVVMTNEQYHAAPGISKSHLDVIARKSPKHYWEKYLNPDHEEDPKSRVFMFGQATHTAILEPETMEDRVVVGLPHDRRSNSNKQAWAEFELENFGRIILTRAELDAVMRIVDNVWAEPEIAGLLTGGIAEQSFFAMMDVPDGEGGLLFDHDTGEIIQSLVKCQPDYRRPGSHIIDLKSTEDASREAFGKSCANYRYPVQQAWYTDVLDACGHYSNEPFLFLCFEKEPPFAIGLYPLEDVAVSQGRIAYERDFARIVTHKRQNYWPSHFRSIKESITNPLRLPGWMKL
ncbi:Exodeoxyribonuclease 8 [compost metagenome]